MLQLRHALETEAVNANERAAGAPLPGARLVAVAFADMVGFTRLGETVPPEELEQLANRLADAAREVTVPPVRFVKTIGDAVMLVSTETSALLDAMLSLVEVTDADEELPQLRVGLAYGPAVSRAGDWFGSPVNLASRVTSAARPGSVLVARGGLRADRGRRPLHLVVRQGPPPQGHQGRRQALSGPSRRKGLTQNRSSACAGLPAAGQRRPRSTARSPSRRRPATTPGDDAESPVRPRTTPSPGVDGRRRGRRVRAAGRALFLPCQPLSGTTVKHQPVPASGTNSPYPRSREERACRHDPLGFIAATVAAALVGVSAPAAADPQSDLIAMLPAGYRSESCVQVS